MTEGEQHYIRTQIDEINREHQEISRQIDKLEKKYVSLQAMCKHPKVRDGYCRICDKHVGE